MSSDSFMRQTYLEEFFNQAKTGKSEAILLPKLEGGPGINLISPSTVASLLKKEISVDKFIIFDCRFDYEYEGGHILDAHNTVSREKVMELLEGHN